MNVLLCDDHQLFADALAEVLRQQGVGTVDVVTSPEQAVDLVAGGEVDVCVMDVTFPNGASGLWAAKEMHDLSPSTPVLMLTARTDQETAAAALEAGARGVAFKVQPVAEVCQAVRRMAEGDVVLDARFWRVSVAGAGTASESRRAADLADLLTAREREVLSLLVAGLRTEAIARQLAIGVTTTRGHVQSILVKLQVHSRIKAVAFAIRNGIVEPNTQEQPGR
jgi:two-component system, NarL family, nitrate/nitrite response regulator NarL